MQSPRRTTRHRALTGALALSLLVTSALAMLGSAAPAPVVPPPSHLVATQALGPEAFGVLPAIRPQDGNGLDYGTQAQSRPYVPTSVVDFSLSQTKATYMFDTMGAVPDSAPVVRLTVAPFTEQNVRDLAARLGMNGPLQIVRSGGTWDYLIGARETTTGASLTLNSRGTFMYEGADPDARCGAAAVTPPLSTPLPYPPGPNSVPPTATATPYGAGTDLCQRRGDAPDDAHAIAAAQDFLTNIGFPPDTTETPHALPPDAARPTLRTVRWAAAGPNGEPLIGREAQSDDVVMVRPDGRVVSASGTTRVLDATSPYRLHSPDELAQILQAGDAYATLTLPNDALGMPIAFRNDRPLAVHITAATLGYSLAYTFDATPYLLPVMIYTGTAATDESTAIGKEIIFTAYVDAVAHPTPQPVPVAAPSLLPSPPDLASLATLTFKPRATTRAEFDALAASLRYDNTTATVTESPGLGGMAFLARYPDGAAFSANMQLGEWGYDSGGPAPGSVSTPGPSPDGALATVQQFIATRHIALDFLGPPTVMQYPATYKQTSVCYPLLINNHPIFEQSGSTPMCGLFATVGPSHLTLAAKPLLATMQRDGLAALPLAPVAGSASVATAQQALDALAVAPRPIPAGADTALPEWQLGRLLIQDDPENTPRQGGGPFNATCGQADPNQFTVDHITLVYVSIDLPTSTVQQPVSQLQPAWLISGEIEIGARRRIAPFTYLYPATH